MKKQTVLDRVEVLRSGDVQLRFGKQIVDGEEVLANEWHRAVIDRGEDVDVRLTDISRHLEALGYPPIAPAAIERIKKFAIVAKEAN